MRWDEIDFGQRVWRIEETKNGESQVGPLVDRALEILKRRRDNSSPFVFESPQSKRGHLYARLNLDPVRQSVERGVAAILKAGGELPRGKVLPLKKRGAGAE